MSRLSKFLRLTSATVALTFLVTSSTVFAAPAVPPVSQLGDDATCQSKLVANAKNYDGDDLRAYLSKRLSTRDPTLSKTVNGPKGLLPVAQKNYDAYAAKAQTISNRIDQINSIKTRSLNGLTPNPAYDFSIANVPQRQADLTNVKQYNANAQPIIELAKQRLADSGSTRYALTRSICASIYGAQVFNLVLPEARKQYIQTRIDGLQLNSGINQALYNSIKSVYEAKKAANVEYDMEGAIAAQVAAIADPSKDTGTTAQLISKTKLILNGSPSSWHTEPQSKDLTEISRQINAQKDALIPVFNKVMTSKLPKVKKTPAKSNGTGGASPPSTTTQRTTNQNNSAGSGSSSSNRVSTASKRATTTPANRQQKPAASPDVVISGFSGDNSPSKTAIDETLPKSNSASTAGCNTRACIIRLVEKQLRVEESPAFSNKVPRDYNINGQPWCASFATYMWRKAGINIPLYINGDQIKSWAEARNKWHAAGSGYKMHSGDIIIFDGPTSGSPVRSQHTALVDRVYRNGKIEVIAGNVRNPSGTNDGVYFQASTNGKKVDYPSNFRGGGYKIWGYVESPYKR